MPATKWKRDGSVRLDAPSSGQREFSFKACPPWAGSRRPHLLVTHLLQIVRRLTSSVWSRPERPLASRILVRLRQGLGRSLTVRGLVFARAGGPGRI